MPLVWNAGLDYNGVATDDPSFRRGGYGAGFFDFAVGLGIGGALGPKAPITRLPEPPSVPTPPRITPPSLINDGAGLIDNVLAESPAVRTNTQFVQDVAGRAEAWGTRHGLGTGAVAGIKKHGYAKRVIDRYQSMFGDRCLATEVRYLDGELWEPGMGLKGTVRLDVVEGPIASPTAVWDFKFGAQGLVPTRVAEIRAGAGLAPGIPINEIRP